MKIIFATYRGEKLIFPPQERSKNAGSLSSKSICARYCTRQIQTGRRFCSNRNRSNEVRNTAERRTLDSRGIRYSFGVPLETGTTKLFEVRVAPIQSRITPAFIVTKVHREFPMVILVYVYVACTPPSLLAFVP